VRNINLKGLPVVGLVLAISDVYYYVVCPVEIDYRLLAKLRHLNLDLLVFDSTSNISLSDGEVLVTLT
jgi:hypothetical protein